MNIDEVDVAYARVSDDRLRVLEINQVYNLLKGEQPVLDQVAHAVEWGEKQNMKLMVLCGEVQVAIDIDDTPVREAFGKFVGAVQEQAERCLAVSEGMLKRAVNRE